jgi:N-carbamoylputrescine amidase
MRIALIQQKAEVDRSENLARGLRALERAAADGARLACFAELAFDPFHPQRRAPADRVKLAEPIPGPVTLALADAAKRHGMVIVANLYERDGDRTFDSSPVIDADGRLLGATRMVHITDFACFHERDWYAPGDRGAPVYETAAGRVGIAICYDRHYPEYMRALALGGADLVVIPQAGTEDEWPDGLYEGEVRTAAFQNGYWVALCNRVGREDAMTFAGESFVCDPEGLVIARAARGREEILLCDVDPERAAASTARRLFLRDRRPELYAGWLAGRGGA